MKRVIIVQARINSTRLRGKVLLDLAGRPMLAQQLRRLKNCGSVDEIVVATSDHPDDQAIVELARREGVRWFQGSEQDVLARFVGAARTAAADVVVRVTGDCPLIDPRVTDRVIQELVEHSHECDYASNVGATTPWAKLGSLSGTIPLQRSFPRGLDVEAMFLDVLLRIDRLAITPSAREHVTLAIRSERPELFLSRTVFDDQDNSDLRWTVDTDQDLLMVRALYSELDLGARIVPYPEMLAYVRAHPEFTQINAGVMTVTG